MINKLADLWNTKRWLFWLLLPITLFAVGIKDKINGSGVNLCDPVEANYYQQTESLMQQSLAQVHFATPEKDLAVLQQQLKNIVKDLFVD